MGLRCPFCHHKIPLYRLRSRFVCRHCTNPLRARLAAAMMTFLFLFIASDGFLVLVWWALSLPVPAPAHPEAPAVAAAAAAAAATATAAPVPGTSPTVLLPPEAVHWLNYTDYLILLGGLIAWALFVWIFGNITRVELDPERLPGSRPHHHRVDDHYKGEESSAK